MQSSDKPSTGTMDANGRQPWLGASAPDSPPAAAAAPPSLRWRARGGPGCCCPGRSARWPRPPSPSSSFCSASMPAATTRISGGRCPHRRRRQCRRDPAHPLSSWPPWLCRPRRAGAPARRHRPGHGRRPVPGGGRRLGAAAGTGRHVAGHTDAGPAALGRIALAMGFGVASHVHAGALHAWLAFREPAAAMPAPASALTAGRRRLGTVVQRVLCAGRHRHQDGVAHARNAPPRRRSRALKPAPARRTAHRNSRRAQASPGIARTRPASAMHRIARRTDRPRPAPPQAPQASAAWRG